MSTSPLYAHQIASVKQLQNKERILDFSDPGTGKTRVEIEDFVMRRKRGGKCALVFAPRSLLRSAWADDIARFAPHIRTSVALAANRAKAFECTADIYITNLDAAAWIAKQPDAFFARFDTLIIDELPAYKHHTSARSKAIARIRKHFRIRRGLTGTPTANGVTDIWHQAFLIDDGQRLGKSFFAFRAATCTSEQVGSMPHMLRWEPKPGAEAAVAKLLEDITIRHVFEDCLSIPPNHTSIIRYHVPALQLDHYKVMERDMILQLAPQIVAAKMIGAAAASQLPQISAVNAAVLNQKLLQIASGAVYDGAGNYHLTDGGRYELVADLIDARGFCVVFYLWKHQRDELEREFSSRHITYRVIDGGTSDTMRHDAVQLFQQGFYKVLLAHPQSAAHGLTLTKATSTIWASPTYNLEHFIQGNRRIYRAGQTLKTETIVVVAPGTLEEKVYDVLTTKNAKQRDLLSLVGELSSDVA